ncbi:MAG: sigma 54-interacting transcriptional regulator [Planctomycetales bacterium]|nr:sigma 54-interacting transcriptional regulator [Planctomycetales bacterium]
MLASSFKPGHLVNNRYRVVRSLGRGGMGEVYLVEDNIEGNRPLALKTLKPEHRHETLQYLHHEFKALSQLRHPNLAAVYDFGVVAGPDLPFFTSEYVVGEDLLGVGPGLVPEALYPLVVQVCRALEYIHCRGLIHHDVKPENILVSAPAGPVGDGRAGAGERAVKLIDFGLVGRVRNEDGGKIPGTVHYIAPEIIRGQAVDRRSDLYSLGVVLYQILTGTLPFDGRNQLEIVRGHVEGIPAPPRERNPQVPQPLEEIVLRLLAKEPAERFSSANEVIVALNRVVPAPYALETKETRESYILSGRFVGRDEEFATLREAISAATGVALQSPDDPRMRTRESSTTTSLDLAALERPRVPPAIAVVEGEAGVGKSRLLSEMRVVVQLAGVPFLQGSPGQGGGAAWGPVVQVLRQAVRLAEAGPLLDRHGAEIRRLVPEAAEGRSLPAPVRLPPEEERVRLLHTVSQFLVDLSRRRPLVVHLADLHAADAATCEFFLYLARYLPTLAEARTPVGAPAPGPTGHSTHGGPLGPGERGAAEGPGSSAAGAPPRPTTDTAVSISVGDAGPARLFLCATGRPDEIAPALQAGLAEIAGAAAFQRISLKPLALPDVKRLLVSMLGMSDDPEPLARRLHEETAGNPYLVEEVMKGLVEEGLLWQEDGRWVAAAASLQDLPISARIAEAVGRRLSRLSPPEREALGVLAALGRPATLDLLVRLVGSDGDTLLPVCEGLVRRGLLEVERPEGAVTYGIPAKPLRDVAYAEIRGEARRDLHARIAETLERGRAEVPEEEAEELARHALLGEDPVRGPRYALLAAARTARLYANRRAIELYEGAERLLPAGDPRRTEAAGGLGELYARVGEYERAVARYRGLLGEGAATAPPEEAARIHRSVAEIARKRGDFATALAEVEAGRSALPAGVPSREAVKLLLVEGTVRTLKGELDAASDCATRGLLALEALGARDEAGPVLNAIGNVHLVRGDIRGAIENYRKAVEAAERARDPDATANAYQNLGQAYTKAGDYPAALAYNRRSLEIKEKIGDIYRIADSLNNLGVLFIEMGDFPTALEYQRRSLAIRERIGDAYGRAQAYSNLGVLHGEMGNTREALRAFERSLEIRQAIGDQDGTALALGNLGVAAHASGDFARALDCLERSVRLRETAGRVDELTTTLTNLGDLYLTIGSLDRASTHFARAEEIAAGNGLRMHAAVVETALGTLCRLREDWDGAERRLRGALETYKEMGNTYGICEAEVTYAELTQDLGQGDRAQKFAKDALKLAEEIRSRKLRLRGLLVKGRIEAELGHEATALDLLTEARRLAEEGGHRENVREAHHALGALHAELARFDAAEQQLLRAREIADELSAGLPEDLRETYRGDRRRRRVEDDLEKLHARMADTRTEITVEQRGTLKRRITDLETNQTRLLRLLEINKALNGERRLPALLDLIMDSVIELTDAERGFLILREGERLEVRAARNINREEIRGPEFTISHSIAEQTIAAGSPLIVTNAQEDERFREQESVSDLKLRSVVCVPLRVKDRVLGAMYLDNRFRKGVFGERDLRLLESFGDQAGIAIENARLDEELLLKSRSIEELNRQLAQRLESQGAELAQAKGRLDANQREWELVYDYENLVGRDGGLRETCRALDRVIPTEWSVLVQGESGTGKELIARAIHFNGARKEGKFVSENCAAISESLLESELFGHVKGAFTGAGRDAAGLFASADGGTLFLDEIGEMSLRMQSKLLRVLQEGEVRPVGGEEPVRVNVRLVTATNQDLRSLISLGRFREDLYYRIAVVTVSVPALRKRREDILPLVRHFLPVAAKELGVPPPELTRDAMAALLDYDWPGNVRELENEIRRLVTLAEGGVVGVEAVSRRIRGSDPGRRLEGLRRGSGGLREALDEVEKALIMDTLEKHRWNKTAAAQELGISRVGFHKKCKRFGIK